MITIPNDAISKGYKQVKRYQIAQKKVIYKNLEELKEKVVDNVLSLDHSIEASFDILLPGVSIIARGGENIDIDCSKFVVAHDIYVHNIKSQIIYARDVDSRDIKAQDIDALGIMARDIKAQDICVWYLNARDIIYNMKCIVRRSFRCKSVKGRSKDSVHKCLNGDIIYT